MNPIIDVHEHIFRGKDIPLKGYLYSRKYKWYINFIGRFLRFFSIIARCIRKQEETAKKGIFCRIAVGIACLIMGKGYRRWADILSMAEISVITDSMVNTFKKNKTDLFVPLMIDYEYWFKNSKDVHIASQIDTIYRDVVLPYKGRIHPFVAFDPARELAYRAKLPSPDNLKHGGPPEKYSSFDLVKEAIRNKGFIGVKIYNSLGYRPLGNLAVEKKRNKKIFKKNKMKEYIQFTGQQFDQVLTELYDYCEKEQVPITAHCVSDGIEAYPGASYDFGNPVYWRIVLDKFPDLHLNLAHFGWSGNECYNRKGHKRQKAWVNEICDMLKTYKYLFVDAAHHEVIIDKKVPEFVKDYQAICNDFPDLIQKRLLFGIDWHVISRVDDFQNFKQKYIQVLKDTQLFSKADIADFLGLRALHFLGLLPLKTKPKDGWIKNRKRLAAFYKTNQIPPPRWFTATG